MGDHVSRKVEIAWLHRLFLSALEQLKPVRSEQPRLVTASFYLAATLFSLIRHSSAS